MKCTSKCVRCVTPTHIRSHTDTCRLHRFAIKTEKSQRKGFSCHQHEYLSHKSLVFVFLFAFFPPYLLPNYLYAADNVLKRERGCVSLGRGSNLAAWPFIVCVCVSAGPFFCSLALFCRARFLVAPQLLLLLAACSVLVCVRVCFFVVQNSFILQFIFIRWQRASLFFMCIPRPCAQLNFCCLASSMYIQRYKYIYVLSRISI